MSSSSSAKYNMCLIEYFCTESAGKARSLVTAGGARGAGGGGSHSMLTAAFTPDQSNAQASAESLSLSEG